VSPLSLARGLARFAVRLRAFCEAPIDAAVARRTIGERLARRETAVLQLVERLLREPRSPYPLLFRAAGCELGDVRALVRTDGVEGMLQAIARAGVYVSFREFKGQQTIERGGERAAFSDEDFDSPLTRADFWGTSGGTHGRPRRILIDLDYIAETAPGWAAWFQAEGWLDRLLVFVTPTYPGIVARQLRCIRYGRPFAAWFSTGDAASPGYRLVCRYLNGQVRRRTGVPASEPVSLGALATVARRLADMAARGTPPCVSTPPSTAARIAMAALEEGLSLQGVAFLLGGEPVTEARRQTIAASGAGAFTTYGTSELGPIGVQCSHASEADEVHLLRDGLAVVSRPCELPSGDTVESLLFTALLPSCPKLALNVEIGDSGTLVERACGCGLGRLGYHQTLHTVRSFEKLTGEGATIRVADLYRVMEEALPRRFGGTAADYQLLENETPRGLPSYALLVSPEVGPLDERALVTALLEELGRLRRPYPFMVAQWARADAVRVCRERPRPTARGKVLPYRTLERDAPA
jgi:hypothetical protein